MTFIARALLVLLPALFVAACSMPAWMPKGGDPTEATMDPYERSGNDMRRKQDAAPPVVDPATATPKAPAPAPAR